MLGQASLFVTLALAASPAVAAEFSGAAALESTRRVVAFGPRPPGSAAIRKLQGYIVSRLKGLGCEVIEDAFTAQTPNGAVAMKNIIARFPGPSGRAIVLSGHYDTKLMPGLHFVGANDGGSSAGFLLEMARVTARAPRRDDLYLVWFDGEEAFAQWSDTDGIYGSRHLAARWASDGTLGRIRALINVDMIGDRDLGIMMEMSSSAPLRRLVWQVAADLGYRRHFLETPRTTDDDHVPFLRHGVNAMDLIDFDYGPDNRYWHTEQDTIDKLGAGSLEAVGRVVAEAVRRLERQ